MLWLSVSSPDFYCDVYKRYRGFGILYVLNLYLISGIIFCLWSFMTLVSVENDISPANPDVEYILRQIPEVQYDGVSISTSAVTPYFLYTKNNKTIVAIDLEGKLDEEGKKSSLIIFRKDYIRFPVSIGLTDDTTTDIQYKYLGNGDQIITYDKVVELLPQLWRSLNKTLIYVVMPIGGLLYFLVLLLSNITYAALIWAIGYFFGIKISPQDAYRLTMFAAGASVLALPILFVISPSLTPLAGIINLVGWGFMVMGLMKFRKM